MRLEELLESNARATPDAVALMEAGGRRCTYRELDDLAEEIADRLRAVGIAPGDRVGLCAAKRIETVAAAFGVMKAGAAYVPADPVAPAARSASMFADCSVRAVLVDPERRDGLSAALGRANHETMKQGEAVCGLELLCATSPCALADEYLAYVLYTSGSTGKPKGVSHSHASALAFVDWCGEEFQPTRADRFSSHAPLHFDLSILDIYVAIKHGAAIRLIDTDESRQPASLAALIAEEKLTFWYSTPMILRAMVEYADLDRFDHSSLRIVCFAGEVFPVAHLRALAERWPRPAYYNLYGPTETNVCTFYRVKDPCSQRVDTPIPIGFACSDDRLRVTSHGGEAAPRGQEGELWVRGGSVMKGYWGAPEKNAEAFADADGCRWYRTGDIVMERDDGALVFRGRRDRMIKRRGYRIELGEIEAALSLHEHVGQAAVIALPDAAGDTRIIAFYTWAGPTSPSLIAMKRHLSQVLPVYMSPDRLQVLPSLQRTSTDKIDYQHLQEAARGFLSD